MTLTIRGDKGPDVLKVQTLLATHGINVTKDGVFGEKTEEGVRQFQKIMNLDQDGVVGAQTWARLENRPPPMRTPGPSPACRAALASANAAWPNRNKSSDGIMGDARHQKTKSDHNVGNAVDITHDPGSGCDGEVVAQLALTDERVTYVIWNRHICSRERIDEGWRPYSGTNPHTHHVHISVRDDKRESFRSWPWHPTDKGQEG